MTSALLVIDLQNDFLPGGALAVGDADAVVAPINALMDRFPIVAATQDWHPADHGSFAANHPGRAPGEVIDLHGLSQVLWPTHCVQGTPGAAFADGLRTDRFDHVARKGMDPTLDSYSGFFDNGHRHATGLHAWLRARGVTAVWVAGVATDYCVKFTALDAVALGLRTHLVVDACRGVNLHPGDIERAIGELAAAGVHIVASSSVPSP